MIASSGLYRPLTTLSYLFNYAVLGNGTHPAGYHLLNLLLQAIDVALVYLVGLAIFEEIAPAFALAAIWSVHPLLTESVTNIVGRSDQLAAFGVLAGLLLHIRAGSAAGRRKLRYLAALALVVGIGMFSKESAIVVLAAMALYDLAYPGRKVGGRAAGDTRPRPFPSLCSFTRALKCSPGSTPALCRRWTIRWSAPSSGWRGSPR